RHRPRRPPPPGRPLSRGSRRLRPRAAPLRALIRSPPRAALRRPGLHSNSREIRMAEARTITELVTTDEALPFAFHASVPARFRPRVEPFLELGRRRGFDELELAPPVCRFLWQHGIALPPPVFLSLAHQLFLGAVCTGLLFGTGMTLFLGVA